MRFTNFPERHSLVPQVSGLLVCCRKSQALAETPQLSRPIPVHAGSLDQQKECAAQQQHKRQTEGSLQAKVKPEVLPDVQRRRKMLDAIKDQRMEEVDAVAHPSDIGDDSITKNHGGDTSAKSRDVKQYDHEGKNNMTNVAS